MVSIDNDVLRSLNQRGKDERMDIREAFVRAAADPLGRGSATRLANDERVEWRGTISELRARLVLDGTQLSIDVKFDNELGDLSLAWNREWVEEPGPGEVWDDTDWVRIFIGKGACIHTIGSMIGDHVATAACLPAGSLRDIAEVMSRHYIHRIELDEGGLEVRFDKDITTLPGNKVDEVGSALRGIVDLASVWANVELTQEMRARQEAAGEVSGFGYENAPTRAKCKYCTTTFLWSVTSTCPNCGAPA